MKMIFDSFENSKIHNEKQVFTIWFTVNIGNVKCLNLPKNEM